MPTLPINTVYSCYLYLRLGLILFAVHFIFYEKHNKGYSKFTPFVLSAFILLICVFANGGDYWTYLRWYETDSLDEHIEPIWIFVKSIVPWNYSLFRFFVWGTGLIVMSRIIDRCRVDKAMALCLMGSFYIVSFCYARAAIAIVFLSYGAVLLYSAKSDFKSSIERWTLVLFFMGIGLLMHRSMLLVIPAMLFPKFHVLSRNSLILFLALFPLFAIIFNALFPYLAGFISDNDYYGEFALNYLSLDYNKTDRFLGELFPRLPILGFYLIALFALLGDKFVPKTIRMVATAAFAILYTSFLFATVISVNGITYFYRVFNMAYPFIIVTIAYAVMKNRGLKGTSVVALLMALFFLLLEIRYFMFINPNLINDQMLNRYLI